MSVLIIKLRRNKISCFLYKILISKASFDLCSPNQIYLCNFQNEVVIFKSPFWCVSHLTLTYLYFRAVDFEIFEIPSIIFSPLSKVTLIK